MLYKHISRAQQRIEREEQEEEFRMRLDYQNNGQALVHDPSHLGCEKEVLEELGADEKEFLLQVEMLDGQGMDVVFSMPSGAARVDFTEHSLVELPAALQQCAWHLKELVVSSAVLTTLPEWLVNLDQLESLRIGGGVYAEGQLEQACPLLALPVGLGALKALHTLDLSGCKMLSSLPCDIGDLMALQTLDLRECEALTVLPNGLSDLTALGMLDLSSCIALEELPGLLLTALQILNLWGCEGLKALPERIGALEGLQTLILQALWLTELPEGLKVLTVLHTLNLHGCQDLKTLPKGKGIWWCCRCWICQGVEGWRSYLKVCVP